MKNNDAACARWFQQATGNEPYPYQIRFANGDWLRNAVPVPGHSPFNPANRYHPENLLNSVSRDTTPCRLRRWIKEAGEWASER